MRMPVRLKRSLARPWRAQRKRDGTALFLGYYATKEEAEEAEREYDRYYPSARQAVREGKR